MTKLKHKIELYVPTNTIEQEQVLYLVFHKFCGKFGGATAIHALSGWIMEDGSLAKDRITIVFSYVKEITPEIIDFITKLATGVKDSLKEEAITVIFDDEVEFI